MVGCGHLLKKKVIPIKTLVSSQDWLTKDPSISTETFHFMLTTKEFVSYVARHSSNVPQEEE